MESNKVNGTPLADLIYAVFGKEAIKPISTDGSYCMTFSYNKMNVKVYISTDRYAGECFEIEISDGESNFTPIWILCAYFENRKYNMYFNQENALDNLRLAKQLIDENKLFFVYSDVEKQERKLKFGDSIKELPYPINIDREKEMISWFGEEGKRVAKNTPVCIKLK